MFQDTYRKLDNLEKADLLEKVNRLFDGHRFDVDSSVVMSRELPFYPGFYFYDIADHKTMPQARRFVVGNGDDFTVLNFTNQPIYDLNKTVPLILTADDVADYVRFFFSFVRGKYGRFILCESIDDMPWKEEPPMAARKAVAKMLLPLSVDHVAKDKSMVIYATMVFKDSLFRAKVSVSPEGFISITDEQLLIDDMPVSDDIF